MYYSKLRAYINYLDEDLETTISMEEKERDVVVIEAADDTFPFNFA